MLVHVVDPSAYTPPYDDALCAALARAGVDVELHTSRFAHGAAPRAEGYVRREDFYRAPAPAALRRFAKLAQHVPDMLRYRRRARAADVVHFQWLPVQPIDARLLPDRPLVLTAHDVLPREPRPGQLAGQRRLYERVDAVVVHSEHGRARLVDGLGLDPGRVHVIRHGALSPWARAAPAPLPAELADSGAAEVVLFFGLLRPYKGLDVLLRAWRGVQGAELWIVGMPRMDIAPLRAAAPEGVRWLTRFVSDGEMGALMRRASLAVLPYREIDQSGVAFSALAAALPLIVSDAGGLPDLAAAGAARTFPAGDAGRLRTAIVELLADRVARERMAAAARAAAAGDYSWDAIALETRTLYERVLAA
ncbi:MAG TPA: glycosyltransferase family 4 protein [Solirubrobacteraceae bacterium]|nr:glycosyltransferase family 4 protein [Solirubrobacteraceae bacterium]